MEFLREFANRFKTAAALQVDMYIFKDIFQVIKLESCKIMRIDDAHLLKGQSESYLP